MSRYFYGNLLVALSASVFCGARAQDSSVRRYSAQELGRMMAETPKLGAEYGPVMLAPDGHWVVYGVTHASMAENETTMELWLQHLPESRGDLPPPVRLPKNAVAPRWRPGNQSISFILLPKAEDSAGAGGFTLYEPTSGKHQTVKADRSVPIGGDYEWSPRGNFVAFIAPVPLAAPQPSGLDPRRGVPFAAWRREDKLLPDSFSKVFVLDVRRGELKALTPDNLRVKNFAWSPDESMLAVVIDRQANSQGTATDLTIVDRASGRMRNMIARAGGDDTPLWSPDGRWIAFSTQNAEPDYLGGWPAVVAVDSARIITFPGAPKAVPFWWNADNRHVLFGSPRELAPALMRADISTSKIVEFVPLPASTIDLPYDTSRSLSADGRYMAFVRSSPSAPPELYLTRLDSKGLPEGTPRQLTVLSPGFPLRERVRAEIVRWPSKDGKFSIHALLITPASAWNEGKIKEPLPTLLSLRGGPSMISRAFADDGWRGIEIAAAARGYAVLVPNTRGRGGYGDELLFGIRDAKSYVAVPFDDAIVGIDMLIERGISDARHLGICGHSYGGTLVSYAITQTNRFKAAIIHEGGSTDLFDYIYPYEPGTWRMLLARDLIGIHEPLSAVEQAGLLAQSAVLHASWIKTPTLLQYGAHANAGKGLKLFSVLRYFKVPAAFFVYDEPHVFFRPAAIADDITRSLEWLDHWVRGMDYPDAQRAGEYNTWKKRSPR